MLPILQKYSFFFFNDTATTEIYTLSLHDALPILDDLVSCAGRQGTPLLERGTKPGFGRAVFLYRDRKSTRLNSSHLVISYAVFCLKKKKNNNDRYKVAESSRIVIKAV